MEAVEPVQPRIAEKSEMGFGAPLRSGVNDQVHAEDRVRLALDTIPALLHSAEADGSLDYFNQRWLDFLGVPLDDIKGWGWTSQIHPDDVDAFVKEWRSALRTGAPLEAEARVRRQDGVYRWMLHRKVPLRDEQGKVVKWYGSSLDIDELKRSEFYLAEGQRLGHVGSWSFKPDGTCDYWSREMYEILGFDPDAGTPTIADYLSRVHPEDREIAEATIQRMIAAGEGCDLKKRIIRPDGAQRMIRCVGMPIRDHGVVTRFVGTLMDITEQEELTQKLRRREAYLAEAQRLSHTGSFGWNVVTGERTWSEEVYRILGYDPSVKPTFDRVRDRVHPDDLQIFEEARARASEGKQVDFEHRLLMPDGSVKHLHAVGYGVQKDGKYVELVGTAMDITERKRAEETIRRNQVYLAEAQRLSKTGSWAWSPDTGFRYWSEECYRVLGFDSRDGLPRVEEFIQRIHPDDQPAFRESASKAERKKSDEEVDYRIVHPDGAVRDIHSIGHPVFSPCGDLIEFTGTVIDITDRKRSEEELRRSEAYLAEAQRLSHTGSFGWKPDTGEVIWSGETYRIFEYDRAVTPTIDLVAQRVHPEDRADFQSVIKRASEGASEFEHAYRLLLPDGRVKHVHALAHATPDASGNREFVGAVTEFTDQKRAEETLRESEAYLSEAQRLSQTGSWAWSPDQDIRYWSEECYRVLSFNPQDGLPRFEEFFQRIHPDDQPGFRELIQTAIRDKAEWEADYRIVHPGGAARDIHVVGHPVLSTSGDLVEFVGTVIDITEQRQARAELEKALAEIKKSEDRLRVIIDTIPTMAWTDRPDGSCEFLSRGWLDYTGLSLEEALDWGWTVVIHSEDSPALKDKWLNAVATGKPFEAEARFRRADGKYRWCLCRGVPLRDETGNIIQWHGTTTDIEDRKRAEEELRTSERQYRHLVDTTPAFIHTASPDGALDFLSRGWLEYGGLTLTDLKDWRWTATIHPEDVEGFVDKWRAALESGEPFEAESRVRRADGEYCWFLQRNVPLRDETGKIVKWYGTGVNITERKRAEAALQDARAELERVTRVTTMGELAASIAHEINQPLAGVVTSANAGLNWLAANPPNLSKTRETLERILRDGTRGGEVLARIRALLKRTPSAKTLVSVNQIVRDVLALTAGELRQHLIELSLDLGPSIPAVLGDTVQLQQVLLNLIKNAVEAMAGIANGQRTLRIQSRLGELDGKPAVVVELSDTGTGLSSIEATRLFEAFHTTKPQGMGMGLWISRSIIENHHGRLTASSNHGPGATFVVMLPKATQEQT